MRLEHGVLRVRPLPAPIPSGIHPPRVDDGLGYRTRHPDPVRYLTDWSYRANPALLPRPLPLPILPNPRTLAKRDRMAPKPSTPSLMRQWEKIDAHRKRVSNSPRR